MSSKWLFRNVPDIAFLMLEDVPGPKDDVPK